MLQQLTESLKSQLTEVCLNLPKYLQSLLINSQQPDIAETKAQNPNPNSSKKWSHTCDDRWFLNPSLRPNRGRGEKASDASDEIKGKREERFDELKGSEMSKGVSDSGSSNRPINLTPTRPDLLWHRQCNWRSC